MMKILPLVVAALLVVGCSAGSDSNVPAPDAVSPTTTAATNADASAATTRGDAGGASDEAEPGSMAATGEPASEGKPAEDIAHAPATADNAAASSETANPAPDVIPAAARVPEGTWVEGENYFVLEPQQARLTVSDKVEVVEVFSYGCPACNSAQPWMRKLTAALPSWATMEHLPVSFRPDENFPLYQRAFYTAQAFGVARKAHNAMFEAIWKEGNTIGTYNMKTGRPKAKDNWPTIEDIAGFYAGYGVDPAQFVATSKSFAIDTAMKRADQMIKNWGVNSTPTLVIDGKYRYTARSAGSYQKMIDLTLWLIHKERRAMQAAATDSGETP